jgi:hypothetical protein
VNNKYKFHQSRGFLQVLTAVLVIAGIILTLISAVYLIELQSTIAFVIDKGGIWLDYSSGVGRIRLTGFQIRLMPGHPPRAWMRKALTGKLIKADFSQTIKALTDPRLKPINIPLRGAFDIGVKIIIRELNVQAKIGIEDDAASTALLCGCIVTLLQALRAVSTRGRFVPKGNVTIQPVFNRPRLSIRLKCILAIKARHIIREVIESHARRGNDGQSPDREHYANHNGKYTQHG